MNTQPNKPLSLAVLRARNGEIPGFEDFYLLTCRNTYSDIKEAIPNDDQAFQVLRSVYAAVWQRKANLPETGIVRPWIRVLIREKARTDLGIPIEEFSSELTTEPVRDLDERFTAELVKIEEELNLIYLPDTITGKKNRGSLPVAVVKFLLGLSAVGIALFLAFGILRSTGISLRELQQDMKETEEETQMAADSTEEETTEEAAPEEQRFGWIETREGRQYRQADGRLLESEWLEDGDHLYYFDDTGFAATGSRRFSNQTVLFADDGEVTAITRTYGHEKNQTVLSVKMRDEGREKDAEYIVDDSIVLDDDWIYYLYDENGQGGLPLLLRVRREGETEEHISDRVAGYLVLAENVWYCTENRIERFEKGLEGTSVSTGYTVTEEEDGWYLRDNYGRAVSGTGGYESISGRIYRVEDGLIRSVRQDVQSIGSYSFRPREAGKSPSILLNGEREYLRQGNSVDALAVLGETLYYSIMLNDDTENPKSQIWRVDVYTGSSKAVSGVFPGRIRAMLPFGQEDAILMEYRPGSSDSPYGQLAVIAGGSAYRIQDAEARKDGYSGGHDQLNPVWFDGDRIQAYWRNCAPVVASDGTAEILESRTITLSGWERTRLGEADGSVQGPVFFAEGGAFETIAADPARPAEESESTDETEEESRNRQEEENIPAQPGAGTAEVTPEPASPVTPETAPGETPTEAAETPGPAGPGEAPAAVENTSGPGVSPVQPVPVPETEAPAGPGIPGPGEGIMETVAPIPSP